MIGFPDLVWRGDWVVHNRHKIVRIVEDQKYPSLMWRVEMSDGRLTDMVNRTRAKDAALHIACSILNGRPEFPGKGRD